MAVTERDVPLARSVTRLAHLDLAGAGQVTVEGRYAYVGHAPNAAGLGTTIVDVADPRRPRTVATIELADPRWHSHKVRVAGDVMIVNHERNNSGIGRKADHLAGIEQRLRALLGRAPTDAEIAAKMALDEADVARLRAGRDGGDAPGFIVYDVSERTRPRRLAFVKTGGIGVHRFDMDADYAYISTEMDGYVGNILVIYDIRTPERPVEVSRWWMPGQHAAGGEMPHPEGRQHRLHHALRFGDELWAAVWHAGIRVIDIADIGKPATIGAYNYHPPFPEPTHTVMPLPAPIGGRRIALAIDEEEEFYNAVDARNRHGRPHGSLWTFDATDTGDLRPLAMFELGELDSPWSRTPGGRFGAHQFCERPNGTLVYAAWFAGGLRIVDVADPFAPTEVGHFIPEPVGRHSSPQTNDVDVDARGLVYIVDRYRGFDILEFAP